MKEVLSLMSNFVKERGKFKRLSVLRRDTHRKMYAERMERIRTNPIPTETEIAIGAFEEMVEPQVREAVLEFNRKGYATYSSGFFGKHHEFQAIAGYFRLDEAARASLDTLDVQIEQIDMPGSPTQTAIHFKPQDPDLEKIKEKWDAIAAILPDRGQPALPNFTDAAVKFRKIYAPGSPYLEEWQAQIIGDPPQPKNNPKNPVWVLVTALVTAI